MGSRFGLDADRKFTPNRRRFLKCGHSGTSQLPIRSLLDESICDYALAESQESGRRRLNWNWKRAVCLGSEIAEVR